VVVFAHGQGASKNIYTWVGQHLASWGFVVLLFSVPRPDTESTRPWVDGIRASIDRLKAENARPGPLQGLVDVRRVGVAGHSMGAMAALLAAAEDQRIGAVAALGAIKDPCPPSFTVEPFRPLAVPVQLQAGSRDGAAPPEQSQKHFDFHVGPRQLVVIGGANHIGFLDRGLIYEASRITVELGLQPDGPATISRDDQERISRTYLTAWLGRHLKGEQAWAPYLDGEMASRDLREGVLARLEHRP
jgi:predicted dienelactone hydrolase